MGTLITELDPHELPPETLRARWKQYAKADQHHVIDSGDIDDLSPTIPNLVFCRAGAIPARSISEAFKHLSPNLASQAYMGEDAPVYGHPHLPGLLLVPSLLPPDIQGMLLGHLLHRDLSDPHHLTNLHPHYEVPYPSADPDAGPFAASFFSLPPDSPTHFQPRDPSVHKPLSMRQVLDRKLRWLTIGGQYDWTRRVYPEGEGAAGAPAFPPDVAAFLEALFPETRAQAAIVNIYTPGDTMMMHRDVSEASDRGLVSVSLGCDALFMIAPGGEERGSSRGMDRGVAIAAGGNATAAAAAAAVEGKGEEEEEEERGKGDNVRGKGHLLLRLRSGDVLCMTGKSRFAFHGVPKVLQGTCPEYLASWPAAGDGGDAKFGAWSGWMRNKRINLNVRQMN